MDRQADGVADARGIDPLILAVGIERQDVGSTRFALVVTDVRPGSDRDEQGFAVLREFKVARPVAAAADLLSPAGNILDEHLGWSPVAFVSPVLYGKRTTESVLPTYTCVGFGPAG